jgi:hypothetical protein
MKPIETIEIPPVRVEKGWSLHGEVDVPVAPLGALEDGQVLRDARRREPLITFGTAGRLLGIGPAAVSEIERGLRAPVSWDELWARLGRLPRPARDYRPIEGPPWYVGWSCRGICRCEDQYAHEARIAKQRVRKRVRRLQRARTLQAIRKEERRVEIDARMEIARLFDDPHCRKCGEVWPDGLDECRRCGMGATHREASEDDDDEPGPCYCGEPNPLYNRAFLDKTCRGSTSLHCDCGGDICVCHYHGEVECLGCVDCEGGDFDDDDDFDDDEPGRFGGVGCGEDDIPW